MGNTRLIPVTPENSWRYGAGRLIPMSSNSNQNVVKENLKELKNAWDKQWQRNDILDSKATSIIQVAGTVTALIFGFVTFSQSANRLSFIPFTQGLIIASIFFGLGSIILSILVIRTRHFSFPMNPDCYLKDHSVADQSRKPDSDPFDNNKIRMELDYEDLFKKYLKSLKKFHENSKSKGRFIFAALIFLVISVALTVAAVIAIFSWQSLPAQPGNGKLICKELITSGTRVIYNSNKILTSHSNDASIIMLCTGR